ncbi:MAG TPA: ribulose bisphosphate carboxylase small subunit [Actinomycetes bacterium]|nr:ribulose bisphosphate carboxylase small subunit [Actinomycetes bacterium]
MTTASPRRYETFSYLPPLTRDQLVGQIDHILAQGLIPAIEHTRRPDPRDAYWSMWKLPLFEVRTSQEVLAEMQACVDAHPGSFVKLNGYDPRRQAQVASFVVRRPADAASLA